MNKYSQKLVVHPASNAGQKIRSILKVWIFALSLLPGLTVFAQQPGKIQKAIDAIKVANYNESDDYVTDGQRVVWVKSYKKWTLEDLVFMKKEDPSTLRFLGMAAQRGRYDVLEQLLPDYYRANGGVKAFAADVIKEQDATNASIQTKAP